MNSRDQSVFVVTFRPTIVGIDPIRALRAVLKFAQRRFGLCAVEAREIADGAPLRAPALLTDDTKK
jgi:hypothetical protein